MDFYCFVNLVCKVFKLEVVLNMLYFDFIEVLFQLQLDIGVGLIVVFWLIIILIFNLLFFYDKYEVFKGKIFDVYLYNKILISIEK